MTYKKFSGAASAALIIVIAIVVFAPAVSAQIKYKALYNFTGGTDGGTPWDVLAIDAAGNLYGTTNWGGLGFGTVFELTPNSDSGWTESVLYSFNGGADGSRPIAGLIFDPAGNLYGTTYSGGHSGVGRSSS